MIKVENLTKAYGDFLALDRVSFEVGEGEIVGFLGPNGAGKTTTMRILTGFLPATSGKAALAGYDVFTQSMQVRQNVGYLPENNPLYPEMRVREYLMFRAKMKNVPRAERRRRVFESLERCGGAEFAEQLIGTLSKGQRQRAGLADCLLHNPQILILDEPTVGLDPNQIRLVRDLIKDFGKSHTVLLSTHILPEVESVCERFMIINRGRVAAEMTMDELQQSPFIDLEAVAPAAELRAAISKLDGVVSVQQADAATAPDAATASDACRLSLELKAGIDVRAKLHSMMVERQWQLLELRRRALTLEDVFVRITAQDEAAAGAPVEAKEAV